MQELIKSFSRKAGIAKGRLLKPITSRHLRKRLQNNNFTMVSSNCIGSKFYQELDIPYNTPFVGMFIYAPCFIKLLGNMDYYLKSDLSFIQKSKYDDMIPPEKRDRGYPVGLIGDDLEIHFLHYESEEEARTKWMRRRDRMTDNLFITFTDRDLCNESHLEMFDQLEYPNKVCFTADKYPSLQSSVWVNEYQNEPHVGAFTQSSII